jgi:hypothetical protein
MIGKRYLFVILLLIFLGAPQRIIAQQPGGEPLESLWINLPSTPLRFFPSPGGNGYSLNNYSIAYIVGYRLGCVSGQGGSFRILSKRAAKAISLKPMTGNEVYGKEIVALVGPAFEPCKKGKLTVIEVQFEDGATWKIK